MEHRRDRAKLLQRAEHLLWVLARCDVEDLAAQRQNILKCLHTTEMWAAELGVSDLYREVARAETHRETR